MLTNIDVFVREFEKFLSEEYQRRSENLSTGSAGSFEAYQREVGFISGLRFAADAAVDAKQRANAYATNN